MRTRIYEMSRARMRRERRIVVIAYFINETRVRPITKREAEESENRISNALSMQCNVTKYEVRPRQLVRKSDAYNSQQPVCIVRSSRSHVSYMMFMRARYLRVI